METIAVFNTKGGSGKSATVVFLADFLSSRFDKSVLVVDLDPQQSSSVALLGEEQVNTELDDGKCLATLLQHAAAGEKPSRSDVRALLMERPRGDGLGRATYLGPVHAMACREDPWEELDRNLNTLGEWREKDANGVLVDVLKSLKPDFDICLVDFPAHDTGHIARNGLRAADWWILPCVPDRASLRTVGRSIKTFSDVCKGIRHRPKLLGTLLTICQLASTSEYKWARQSLEEIGEEDYVPRMFETTMKFWSDARDALNDTRWGGTTSLKKKYSKSPLYDAGRKLAKEVLERLGQPAKEVRTGMFGGLPDILRRAFARDETE